MIGYDKPVFSGNRVVLIACLAVALVFGGYWFEHHVAIIETRIQNLGQWAGIGFVVLFMLLTPLFFSVDVLCLMAGALFSLPIAIGYVLIATMLASAFIFLIGRLLARERIQTILAKNERLKSIDQLIQYGGFKILFLLRLLPIPFAPLSYAMSVSKTEFMPYWLATTGIFVYHLVLTYFGFTAAHVSKQVVQGGQATGPSNWLLVGGFVFCIAVVILIVRIAKAEIAKLQITGQ